MKKVRHYFTSLVLFISLLVSGMAFAAKGSYQSVGLIDGKPSIKALRANVQTWRDRKGLDAEVAFKIRRIELSKTGKSAQILVQNKQGSKQVYALNVALSSGQVSNALNLGFIKPSIARKIANAFSHQDNGQFAGINFIGLNPQGNYVFKEATSTDAVVVNAKSGKIYRYNSPSWLTNYTTNEFIPLSEIAGTIIR